MKYSVLLDTYDVDLVGDCILRRVLESDDDVQFTLNVDIKMVTCILLV